MPLTVSSMALMLFLIANPIGNVPVFVYLTKDFEFRHQRWILFREAFFSMILAYFFLFLGEPFLNTILIELYSVYLAGGILVFLISLNMIFPVHSDEKGSKAIAREPFIVPIAAPLISGGGVFATVMILAKQAPLANVSLAILIAWIPVIFIVIASVYLQKILGKRGLIATEQLMGMLLLMLSIGLITKGLHAFGVQSHISFLNHLTS
jgi:multiple antibiotic resistance protein